MTTLIQKMTKDSSFKQMIMQNAESLIRFVISIHVNGPQMCNWCEPLVFVEDVGVEFYTANPSQDIFWMSKHKFSSIYFYYLF